MCPDVVHLNMMCPYVVIESAFFSRPVGTVQTNVGFLARVSANVPLEALLGGRAVGTVRTGERFFPGVRSQVGNQIGGFP